LYNYLFARRNGGVFVLRIEDTDRTRFVEGAVHNLTETLKWAGLEFDEGPYTQSERLEIYRRHAAMLVEADKAYYAFDTPEELEEMRKAQELEHRSPKYDRRALRLSPAEVKTKLDAGVPAVIRLKVPDAQTVAFDDLVRGRVEFSTEQIDDQVLLKSDGYPTYHLANVVDDHLMRISHVIRGEEWLSSTPKHVLLYRYFGWDLPAFAHLPLLLNPDKSKLSKRQGDVAVEEYRRRGYLKEALVNFVAFLGWNPGDEREIFSLDELAREFSLDRVGKAGAVFNVEKLNWLNFQHLRRKSDEEVLGMLKECLARSPFSATAFTDEYLLQVIRTMRERVTFVQEYIDKSPYFFRAPAAYDAEAVKKRWNKESPDLLRQLRGEFEKLDSPSPEGFEAAVSRIAGVSGVKQGELVHPLRLAVSGMAIGPGLYDLLSVLGKDEVIRRISAAMENIH
jgi:glutamyl-tRNA synthetase